MSIALAGRICNWRYFTEKKSSACFTTLPPPIPFPFSGGSELFSSCDLRVAANKNVKIQSVHSKLGITPGWGGARNLTRAVGRNNALWMLASSEQLDATKALEIGLVHHILLEDENTSNHDDSSNNIEDEDIWMNELMQLIKPILKNVDHTSAKVIRAQKRAVVSSKYNEEGNVFEEMWGSEDNQNALKKLR